MVYWYGNLQGCASVGKESSLYLRLRGVILTAKAAEGQAEVNCRVTVANKTEEPVQAVLKVRLTDPDGNRSETSGIFPYRPRGVKMWSSGFRSASRGCGPMRRPISIRLRLSFLQK